jgi:hypothetical protein
LPCRHENPFKKLASVFYKCTYCHWVLLPRTLFPPNLFFTFHGSILLLDFRFPWSSRDCLASVEYLSSRKEASKTIIVLLTAAEQGCQMVYFQTKKSQFGQILEGLRWEKINVFMAVWNSLQTLGIFCDHLVLFVLICCIFPVLVQCSKNNLATLLLKSNASFLAFRRRKQS